MTTPAWTEISTPNVAITRTSELARRSGFMTHQWVKTPRNAERATPTRAARRNGHPCSYCSSHCMNTPAIAVAPSEKFNTPVPR